MKEEYFRKIQKFICVFFIAVGCFISLGVVSHGADYEPPWDIVSTGGDTVDASGANVNFEYHFHRQSFDKKNGTARYEVTEIFYTDRPTIIYSDYLYVNDEYIGEFSSYNGSYNGGTTERKESYFVTLHEGTNVIKTVGEGRGGDSYERVRLSKFSYSSYNVKYDGNGATGSMPTQQATEGTPFNLFSNLFRKEYKVTYDGKGGMVGILNNEDTAKAKFLGWMDNNSFGGYQSYTFNAPYYSNNYADLKSTFGYDKKALYDHFISSTVNGSEKRKSSPYFEVGYYMSHGGQDLINAYGSDKKSYINHWNSNGYNEKRKGVQTVDTSTKRDYPNKALVNNLSLVDGDTVTLVADWELGSVTLPTATYTGHTLVGWQNSEGKFIGKPGEVYTPKKNETLIAVWDAKTYKNLLSYYYGGFTKGEGTTGDNKEFMMMMDTDYMGKEFACDSKYVVDSVVKVPNGFEATKMESNITGEWKTYNVPYTYTQPAKEVQFKYYFYPITYQLTYDLDGGTMGDQSNPSSYNVLYGFRFKNPTKEGYEFLGWKDSVTEEIVTGINEYVYNDMFVGSWIKDVETRTTGNRKLIAQWKSAYNAPPTIEAENKTIHEGEFTEEEWLQERIKEVTANDLEDGDITEKVEVIEDTTDVSVPGNYEITYQVTDNNNNTVIKKITVTVLENKKPVISGEDRWFYESEDITDEMLLEKVVANDPEDGDISDKIEIESTDLQIGVVGVYDITYTVTDSFGKTVTTDNKIHIVSGSSVQPYRYLRFISKKHINTLISDSIWRTPSYWTFLNNSLNKTEDSEAKEHWHLSPEDIDSIKEFNKTHDWSQESNQLFLSQFSHLMQ